MSGPLDLRQTPQESSLSISTKEMLRSGDKTEQALGGATGRRRDLLGS